MLRADNSVAFKNLRGILQVVSKQSKWTLLVAHLPFHLKSSTLHLKMEERCFYFCYKKFIVIINIS